MQPVSAELSNSGTAFDVCTQIDAKENTVDVTTQTEGEENAVDVATQTDSTNDNGGFVDTTVQTDDLAEVETIDAMTQTDEIQSLTVSICGAATPQTNALHLMSPMPGSCVIQYPVEIFYSLKLESVYQLKQRLRNARCIDNWFVLPGDIQSEVVKLVKMDNKQIFTLEVLPTLHWAVCIPNNRLRSSCFKELPTTITTITQLQSILNFFSKCMICSGNADPKFAPVVAKCKGVFKDRSGQLIYPFYKLKSRWSQG